MRKITLVPYDPAWLKLYSDEANIIADILQENLLSIHHIGSTAIPGILAKPIIDILPVVKNINKIDRLNAQFEKAGYQCMGEYGIPGRRFFWKSQETRTHHIHIFQQENPEIVRHIAFKEFMLNHPDYAKAYSLLKENMAKVFPHDVENYVKGKNSFIEMIDYKTGNAKKSQITASDNIIIEAYNPAREKFAEAEINTIKAMAPHLSAVAVEHVGSTAVKGLASKPIIDILIVVDKITQATEWIKPLELLGYIYWDENPDKTHLRFFKGMPPFGMKRTHHIHIMAKDNDTVEQRILFRDVLRKDEKTKNEYEKLKHHLAQENVTDREAYTDKKTDFIRDVLLRQGYKKPISR